MLTSLKPDLLPFEDLARAFAAKELAKKVEEHDRYPFGEFFTRVLDKAYDVGFLGVVLPEKLGGIGGGIGTLCVILENICQTDASLGGIIFTNALTQEIILSAGAEKLAGTIFPKASSAREFLVAFPAFVNPAQVSMLPKAVKSGKDYALTGSLEFLVLGGLASRAIIPARNHADSAYSLFLVDMADKGIVKSDPIFSLGLHACPGVDISLKGVKAKLIGEEGKGRVCFEQASRLMHAAAGAMNAGVMKGSFNEALAYSKERFQGGCQIINWSEVSMLLAGMAIKANVAEMCVAQSCQAIELGGKDWGPCVSAAALHIHELACDVVTDGIQVLGGNGYMKDYGQEKRYRDARQVQALLGIAPLKKISILRQIAGLEDTCAAAF
jgi:alkylation response protein AidB-like acyl-CoA dehydrogenase